ncbi:hypothetical protein FV217_20750 [Methylobacterium sp. WL9]|nr:hypothetical protein FV217_20750 [Methylobacterium sp. WL9]
MARFFFNVFDGTGTTDTDGTELIDWQQARREAIRMAGLILINEGDKLQSGNGWTMEVSDEAGLVLFQLEVRFMETPVVAMQTDDQVRSTLPRR